MELVANIWPIVDQASSLIQRFAARAYAMESDESLISATLKALSCCDFMIAPQFVVPARYILTTEHGTLAGTIAWSETIRLMADIDTVIEKHGGWPLK